MALLATESFDNGVNTNLLSTFGSASVNSSGGVYGSGCAYIPQNNSRVVNYIKRKFRYNGDATANVSINFSFWIKATGPPTGGTYKYFSAGDDPSNWSIGSGIGVDTNGVLVIMSHRNSDYFNPYNTSDQPTICDNNWHFIEYNTLATNSGSAYIYIYQDGKLAARRFGNSLDFSYSFTKYDHLIFSNFQGTSAGQYWIDDLTVWDQLGTTFVGYPKGPIRIQTLRPVADASSNNTTSTGASNYEVLDEENTINTSDYITLSNIGNAQFEMSNLFSNTTNVYGLITYGNFNTGTGGVSNVRIGHKINSTYLYTGAQTYYTKTYSMAFGVVENDFVNTGSLSIQNVNDLIISVDKIL